MKDARVVVVEDNPSYRKSLATFLGHADGFELAEAFGNADALLRASEKLSGTGDPPPWDLVLMDIELPGTGGIDATRSLRQTWPELPVVMLTVFEDPRVILAAITAGANGYVLKKATVRELTDQLRSVLDGGSPLSPAVAGIVIDLVRKLDSGSKDRPSDSAPRPARLDLTEREQDVLRCLVRGRSYLETADDLGIREGTVRTHVRSVYRKLQVHSVAQAIRKAMECGLV